MLYAAIKKVNGEEEIKKAVDWWEKATKDGLEDIKGFPWIDIEASSADFCVALMAMLEAEPDLSAGEELV